MYLCMSVFIIYIILEDTQKGDEEVIKSFQVSLNTI